MRNEFADQRGSFNDVKERYARSGAFMGRCGFGERPALLVIDFEKYATDPESPLFGGPLVVNAVKRTPRLLGEARKRGIPVIYTVVGWVKDFKKEFGPLGMKIPGLKYVHIGEEWAEVCDEVKPEAGEPVIVKNNNSAFIRTPLLRMLKRLKVDTVIVVGHSTSACVRTTACDAIQYGYRTIVVRDCVGDRAEAVNEANLFDLDAKFSDVVSSDEVIEYFRRFPPKILTVSAGSRKKAAK